MTSITEGTTCIEVSVRSCTSMLASLPATPLPHEHMYTETSDYLNPDLIRVFSAGR